MTEKRLKVWGSGPIKIHDIELDCSILEDGTPMLSISKLMKAMWRPRKWSSRNNMPAFIDAKNLQQFVRDDLKQKLMPVEVYDGTKKVYLYEADILPMICNVYLEARQVQGLLTQSQLEVAQKCEILLMAFAKVGIRALIYEQLWFEKFKHPDAFRMLIESYLSDEVRKWSKEFPDEIFIQLDRIYWNQPTSSRNRPQYYAKFIRKYIYDPIESWMILPELDKRNPVVNKGYRKHRHHSIMTTDKWLPALKAQIRQVIWLLKVSPNKKKFEDNYTRLTGQTYQPNLFE